MVKRLSRAQSVDQLWKMVTYTVTRLFRVSCGRPQPCANLLYPMGHTVPALQSTSPRFASDAWNRNPLTVAMAGTVAMTGAHKVTSLRGADSLHAFGVNFENLLSIKALASPRKCRVICGT